MHSSSFELLRDCQQNGGDVLVAVAALVTEGRIPGKISKSRGFYEGPHCPSGKPTTPTGHNCNPSDTLCQRYEVVQNEILNLWKKNVPVCVEVFLVPHCSCNNDDQNDSASDSIPFGSLLLEQWHFSLNQHRNLEMTLFNLNQLINAVRSQLYFSQMSAWLSSQQDSKINLVAGNFRYRLAVPGETFEMSMFNASASKHNFPPTDLGNGFALNVTLISLPRRSTVPHLICNRCTLKPKLTAPSVLEEPKGRLFDDRMHTVCTLKGKHRCEDLDDYEHSLKKECKFVKRSSNKVELDEPSTSRQNFKFVDTTKVAVYHQHHLNEKKISFENGKNEKRNRSIQEELAKTPKLDLNEIRDALKDFDRNDLMKRYAILRGCRLQNDALQNGKESTNDDGRCCNDENAVESDSCDINLCESGDIFNYKERVNIYVDSTCDKTPLRKTPCNNLKVKNPLEFDQRSTRGKVKQRLDFDTFPKYHKTFAKDVKPFENNDDKTHRKIELKQINNYAVDVPSLVEQAKFRKSLDNAASMVFHSRTGLPLTSSPAPVRRGKCFDFDSSITSVSAIKSALYADHFYTDEDSESDCSIVSPRSPDSYTPPKFIPPVKHYRKRHASNLLGSFEESVLNGRLEPVSTVHGFKAELGASGTFIPKHLVVPVTVFFYTLGDNDKISSPYLGHINLGKKGYNVPSQGTLQVTLYNPSGTVVKMFVIIYDLSDMPPNSKTFIRQRTLNIPDNCRNTDLELSPKWLRYLIHLRFMSSKSGRIYLHSDIRIVVSRKSDLDTATGHSDLMHELRSFTHMPTNPKYTSIK